MKKKKGNGQKLTNLWLRFQKVCCHCRKEIPRAEASRDHVIPKSLGGTRDPENIILACRECNSKRGNRPIDPKTLEIVGRHGHAKRAKPISAKVLALWRLMGYIPEGWTPEELTVAAKDFLEEMEQSLSGVAGRNG